MTSYLSSPPLFLPPLLFWLPLSFFETTAPTPFLFWTQIKRLFSLEKESLFLILFVLFVFVLDFVIVMIKIHFQNLSPFPPLLPSSLYSNKDFAFFSSFFCNNSCGKYEEYRQFYAPRFSPKQTNKQNKTKQNKKYHL